MELKLGLNKLVEIGVAVAAVATLILAGCGGGGSSSTRGANTPTSTQVTTSTNQVELALNNGIYHLWGFGFIFNGVPQIFISQTRSNWGVTKVFGAVSSVETAPTLITGLPNESNYFPQSSVTISSWTYPANSSDVSVSYGTTASAPSWTITLNQQDISGNTVLSQIKKNDGTLFSPTLANASAVFPSGTIAYTATYTATSDMMLNIGAGLIGVTSEATMFGSGWCQPLAGQTNMLGVRIDVGNVVSLFSVPTCTFAGQTPIATGTWSKQINGGDVFYTISYPASITGGVWAGVFANAYNPSMQMPNLVINPAGTTFFLMGHNIPKGSKFTTLQPFFNWVGLSALRSAANI